MHFELELYLLRARLQGSAKSAIGSELLHWGEKLGGIASGELCWNQCQNKIKIAPRSMKKTPQFFCLWRSRVHAFHPSLQKPSRPPPDLGNSRRDSAHGHECLFHWLCSDLPPSSGVKCCTLTFSENREAIHLIASFANLITRPQAGCRSPWGCKSGSYTPVIQWLSSWKETASQMAKQEMKRSKNQQGRRTTAILCHLNRASV